uniref:ACB domain-containing protein n=1 Tax=Kalanchoe fedtschenkoi TaxID=63787 RepID=A0A7N0UCH1_KALFE
MVLYQLLLLLRDTYWLAICLTVFASVLLLYVGERKEGAASADDQSGSELEKRGGGADRSGGVGGVVELARSGGERRDLGGGVAVDDEGHVFDEIPERRGGVLGTGEDADGEGVREEKMDDNGGQVVEGGVASGSSSFAGGDGGLDAGVEVCWVCGCENKQLIDDREEENNGSSEDHLVDEKRRAEDDHENKRLTKAENHDDDDDWEGIERTGLEKRFGAAVAYAGRKENQECLTKLSSSVKAQLYGFHKVATQGPCTEPRPRIFHVSARANWKAWRELGDMSPEEAMEKYIALISENVHNWMEDDLKSTRVD